MLLENVYLSLTFFQLILLIFLSKKFNTSRFVGCSFIYLLMSCILIKSNGTDLLQFLPGIRTEGILRQAADVDDVEQRIREYEQGLLPLN